ncbi:peroxisome biogenesis factor [Cystoisospora suis]|uniref:Peroxisome biogenesis factor n=1 Tax=Cystoisospora suis TaxID=483139 RepID=A0A2C6L7Q5_9APIC|nr:peroxisome biogenesis factor [Cystoisospora suis]
MSPPGTSEGSLEPGLVSQATPVFSPGLRTISIATGVRIAPIGIRSCFASPSSRLSGHLFPLKDSNPHFCCVLQIRRRVQQECLSVHSGSTGNCRSHQSPVQTGWLPTLRVFASHYPHISSAEKGSSCPSGRSTLYVGWVGDFLDISDERTLEATMSRETAEFHASGVFARGPAAFPNCRELPRTPSESVLFLGLSATLCKCYGLRPWEVVDVDFVVLRRLVNGSPGSSLQLLSDSHHRTESPRQQHTDSGLRMISPFVEVRPITPADWDVIELHAECIEEELLLQIAVLMPGVPFPVWVRRGQRPAMLVVVTSPPPRGPMQSHEHEQTEDGKGIDLACSAASLSPASPPVCGKGHVRVTGEQRSFERAERKAFSSCREDGRIRKRTSKSACLCPAEVAPFILLGRKTELHVRPFPNSLAPLQQPRHSSITSTAHESSDYRPLREPDVREVDGDDAQHRLRSSAHSDTKGKGELQHAQQRRAVHFYMRVVPFPDAFSKSVAMSYPRPEGGTPAEPATADTADKKPDLELETLTKGQRAVMGPAFPCLNRDSDAPGESFYCLVHYCHIRSFVHQQRWLCQAPVADLLCEFQHPCALHRPEKSPAGQNEHFATAFVWISAQPVGRAKRSEQASGLALLRAFGHPDVPPGTIALSRYFRQIYRFPLCSRVCVTVCTSLPTLPRSLCLTPLCPPGGLVRISGRGQASFRSHNDDFPCSSQSHDSPADEDNQINPSLCIGKQGYGEISIEARDIGLSQFLRTRQGSKLLRHAFLDRLNHVASSTRRAIGLSFFCSSADRAAHEALSECEVPPFGLWDGMLVSVKLPAVVEHSSLVDGAFDQYENAAGRGTTGRSASTSSGSFSDQPPVPQATAAATKSHHSSARGKQDPALSQCRTESKQLTSTVENERTNRLPPRGSGGASETNQRFDRGGSREHLPSTSGSARPLACESSRHDAQSHDCSVRPILDTELAALLDNGLEDLYASTDSEGGGDHSVAHVHSLGTSRAITQTASPIKESGNGAPDPATAQEEEGPNSCPGLNCAAENGSLFTWEANVFNHVDDVSLYSEESDFESDLLLQAPSCEIQAGAAVGGNRKTGGSELTLTGPLYRREEGNGCLSSRAARCGCSGAETQTLAPSWIVLDVIISFRSRVICRVDESDCVSLPGQPQIEKQPMLRHDTALACLSELRTAIIRPATLPPSLAEAWTAASSSTDSVAALVKDSKAHRELKHMSHEQEGHSADGKMARSVQTGTPLVSAVESLLPDISGEDDFEAPYILYKDSFARQLQKGEIVCHVADPIEVSVVFSAAEAATTLTAVGRLTREEDFPRMERSAAFTPSTSCRLTFSNARGEGCCDTGSSLECSVKSLKEEHISNLSTPRWLVINAGDHGTALAQWWLYGTQQPDWELPYVSASESVGKGSLGFIEVDHEISAKPHRRQPIATMAPEMAKLMELQCVQHLAPDAIPWRDTIRFDRKCGTLVLQKGSSCWTTRPELVSFAGAARAPQDNVRWSATDGAEGAEPLYAVPTCEKPLRHGERMLSTQQSGSLGRESSSLQEPQFATVSLPKLDEEAVAHTVQGAPLATVEGDSISLLEALPLLLHSRGACPRPLSPRDFCLSVFGDTPGLLLKKILRRLGVPIASSEDCSKLGCIEAVLRRACPVAPLLPILCDLWKCRFGRPWRSDCNGCPELPTL